MSEANDVKRKLSGAMASSSALLVSVREDAAWKWANNETNLEELNEASASIARITSKFARMFNSMDFRELKKQMDEKDFCSELVNYTKDLAAPVNALSIACSSLLAMHKGRMAARIV